MNQADDIALAAGCKDRDRRRRPMIDWERIELDERRKKSQTKK